MLKLVKKQKQATNSNNTQLTNNNQPDNTQTIKQANNNQVKLEVVKITEPLVKI